MFLKKPFRLYSQMFDCPFPLEISSYNTCSMGCKYCTPHGSLVWLADGTMKPIQDIKIGDKLVGYSFNVPGNKKRRKFQISIVKNIEIRKAEVFEIETSIGDKIYSTKDHYWFTGRRESEYQYQRPEIGKRMVKVLSQFTQRELTRDYKLGYLHSSILGEGTITNKPYQRKTIKYGYGKNNHIKNIRFVVKDKTYMDTYVDYLKEFGFFPNVTIRKKDKCYQCYIYGEKAIKFMIIVPKNIDEYNRGWLAGIIDAEGSSNEVIRIAQDKSKNPEIYSKIEYILNYFGFDYHKTNKVFTLRGRILYLYSKIFSICNPILKEKFMTNFIDRAMVNTKKCYISHIKSIGIQNVYSMETSSGNYISQGYASRNCFVELGRQAHREKRKEHQKIENYDYDTTQSIIEKFAKAFSGAYNPKDPLEYFIHNRYPIVYSNTTDPFCSLELKTRSAEKLLTMFADFQYPVFLQTKNPYIDEYLPIMERNKENMIVYVSLSIFDDNCHHIIENNTPLPSERLKKIETLVSKGFDVVTALNPYFDGLSPDVREYVKRMDDMGVIGIWFDYLHLTRNQKNSMYKNGNESLIQYSDIPEYRKLEVFRNFSDECIKRGMLYETNMWYSEKCSDYGDTPYLNFKFENECTFSVPYIRNVLHDIWVENGKKPLMITWEAMKDMIDSDILSHVFSVHALFTAMNSSVKMSHQKFNMAIGNENTLENILKYMWNEHEETYNWIWQLFHTHVAVETDDNGDPYELRKDGNAIMIYHEDKRLGDSLAFDITNWEGEIVEL